MLTQLAMLKDEHLVLLGFVTGFVMLGSTILGSVVAVQWRKARQTEMELWFKHELHSRGVSVDEIERLVGSTGKKSAKMPPFQNVRCAEPGHFHAAAGAKPVDFNRKLVRLSDEGMIGGLCAGVAQYLRISPFVLRTAYVVATVMTGIFPLTIGYFIACFFVPSDREAVPAMA